MKKQLITAIVCLFILLLFGMIIPVARDIVRLIGLFVPVLLWVLFIRNRQKRKQPLKKRAVRILFFLLIVFGGLLITCFGGGYYQEFIHRIYPFEYGYNGFKDYVYPVLWGINWALLVYCTDSLCHSIKNHFLQVVAAAVLILVFNVLQDQYVRFLYLWREYDDEMINVTIWFLFAVVLHTFRVLLKIEVNSKAANVSYWMAVLLFLCLWLLRPVI